MDWCAFIEPFLGTVCAILIPIIIYFCQTYREKKRIRQEEHNLLAYYQFLLISISEQVNRIQISRNKYIQEQQRNYIHTTTFKYPYHNEFIRLHSIDSTLIFKVWNKYIPISNSVEVFKNTQSSLDFLEQVTEKWKSIYDEQKKRATLSWQKITSGIDDINDVILFKSNELEKKIKDENRTQSARLRFYKERKDAYNDLKKKTIPVEADFLELYLGPIWNHAKNEYDIQLLNKIQKVVDEIGFIKKQTEYTVENLQLFDMDVFANINRIKNAIEYLKPYN